VECRLLTLNAITSNIMSPKSLQKIRKKLQEMYKSPQNRKSSDFISIASQLGRVRDNRGKEPTYVRSHNPALSPPLSIPNHSREMKPGTARSIIEALLNDVDEWESFNVEDGK
jgi:hypothetical protein